MPDIRERSWKNNNCKAAKLLNLLIEAENILIDFDEYQIQNEQCYPEFEELMLQLGEIRSNYTNLVDNNKEILDI